MGGQTPCAEDTAEDTGVDIGAEINAAVRGVGSAAARHDPGAHWRGQQLNEAAQMPLRRIVYGPQAEVDGFVALGAEWNRLVKRSRYNTIFLTHEWQTTWWHNLGEGDLWIVALRAPETNELVGIASLYLLQHQRGRHAGKRVLSLVGCIEVSDYLDLIVMRGWEEHVYHDLLNWLCGATAPAWDVLDLCNLPEDSLTYRTFAQCCESCGLQAQISQEDVAPQFALPLHYETYLQERVDKKQRHEIRRKQRRAERETEVGFYMVNQSHSLEAEVDDFIALQRASREDKADFMTPQMRRFFGAVARSMLDAGYLRLGFLTLNGEKAATLFAFEYDRKFLLYNSGYDPDAHSHLSPGWVLLAYTIQYAIAAGCQLFDFMQGNEEYKYRFGSHDYKVMRVIVAR